LVKVYLFLIYDYPEKLK